MWLFVAMQVKKLVVLRINSSQFYLKKQYNVNASYFCTGTIRQKISQFRVKMNYNRLEKIKKCFYWPEEHFLVFGSQ